MLAQFVQYSIGGTTMVPHSPVRLIKPKHSSHPVAGEKKTHVLVSSRVNISFDEFAQK